MNNMPYFNPALPPIYVPLKAACKSLGVTVESLRTKSRTPKILNARAKVAYILNEMGYSWVQVGNVLCMSDLGAARASERAKVPHPARTTGA